MARPLRFDFPGARHHVMNRGADHCEVYRDDADRSLFLESLGEVHARHGVEIHAYALMDNHYHLLLSTPRANLSRAMRDLGASYTQAYNRRHGRDGPLFRGRFRSRVAMHAEYWTHLLFYLHANPVEAGVVGRLDEARWTSHRAYVGLETPPKWLNTQDLLELHGGVEGYLEYARDHLVGRGAVPEGWDPDQLWAPLDMANIKMLDEKPAPTPLTPAGLAAVEMVCDVTGLPREEVMATRRGRGGNPAQRLACWWLVHRGGVLPVRVAEHLEVSPATVSRMLASVRKERGTGSRVDRWLVRLNQRWGPGEED